MSESTEQNGHCWTELGVWSGAGQRCPKLQELFHCRNCAVFIAAGRGLLDRPAPDDYTKEWTELLALPKSEHQTGVESVLIFRVGSEWLAFATKLFKQVTAVTGAHHVPHRSDQVFLGLVNVEGELCLCFDLAAAVGIDTAAAPARAAQPRLLVLDNAGETWVFTVAEVWGTYRYNPEDTSNIPPSVSAAPISYIRQLFQHQNMTVGVLDEALLFHMLKRRLQ